MKHLINIFVLAFGLLCFCKSFGQKAESDKYKINQEYGQAYFDNLLVEVKDKDSLMIFKNELDSIRKEFTMSKNIPFTLSDHWNLVCSHFTGWVDGLSKERLAIDHSYRSTNKYTVFTSEQIFSEFNIADSVSLKQNPLSFFPFIYKRDDVYNAKWTAILPCSEYLVIRMVHSYPDGSATSWSKERTYYFRKARN